MKINILNNFKKIIGLFASPFFIFAIVILQTLLLPWNYKIIAISATFLFSVISIIYFKKWGTLFFSVLAYIGFYIFLFFVYISQSIVEESLRIDIGNDKYYRNEIADQSDLNLPENLTLVAKIDTVHHIGPGGSDYSAGCIYQGSKISISKLQRSISRNKKFKFVKENIEIPKSFSFESKSSKNRMKFTAAYISEIQNKNTVEIAFDKTGTKMYFYEHFY